MTDDPNDDAIEIEKRRKLLDGDDDDDNEPDATDEDEHGKGKDIHEEDTVMAQEVTRSQLPRSPPRQRPRKSQNAPALGVVQLVRETKKVAPPPTYYFCSLIIY